MHFSRFFGLDPSLRKMPKELFVVGAGSCQGRNFLSFITFYDVYQPSITLNISEWCLHRVRQKGKHANLDSTGHSQEQLQHFSMIWVYSLRMGIRNTRSATAKGVFTSTGLALEEFLHANPSFDIFTFCKRGLNVRGITQFVLQS